MTTFITRLFGFSKENPAKKDDFSHFFIDAKSQEKAKIIKQILREATQEQEALLERYQKEVVVR